MILSDDVSDDDSIDDGTESDDEREKVAPSVQETLRRMMIAAVTWTLVTIASNGKDKRKWVKVKVPHIFIADGKIF